MALTQGKTRALIEGIEAIPLDVTFRQLFRFGTTDRRQSSNVVVRITTVDGLTGYGEACPVAAFTSETQTSVVEMVDRRVKELIVGKDALQARRIVRTLERPLRGCPFTLAAVDIALWDIAGKAFGVPVSTLLGGRARDRVAVHGSVGWDDGDTMAATAVSQLREGYSTLKLYAGRGDLREDLKRIETVRKAVPSEVQFILDLNGLWTPAQFLTALPVLVDLGVVLIEQPLDPSDEAGLAEVVRASTIDVAADESVYDAADVARIGRLRTARVINLGLSKLGGLVRARDCETVARAHALGLTVGSVLELGIATAAGLHLAAAADALAYPSYLIGPLKYERDVTSLPLDVREGHIDVPTGPGLGIDVDVDRLHALDLRN